MSEQQIDRKELLEYIKLLNVYIYFEEISATEEAKILGGYANEYMSFSPSYVLVDILSLLKGEKNMEEIVKSCKDSIHVLLTVYADMVEGDYDSYDLEKDFFDLVCDLSHNKKRFDSMTMTETQEIVSRFIKEYFGENYVIGWK